MSGSLRAAPRFGRAAGLCFLFSVLWLFQGCSALVSYSDRLVDANTGRSGFVTKPASLGGIVGFVAGIPFDVVALPVSYVVYQSQKDEEEEGLDPLSTLLFPSFVLWRAGILVIGTPLDALEFAFYRAWTSKPPPAPADLENDFEEREGDGGSMDGGGLGRADPLLQG